MLLGIATSTAKDVGDTSLLICKVVYVHRQLSSDLDLLALKS
jgi:hypothetical protein